MLRKGPGTAEKLGDCWMALSNISFDKDSVLLAYDAISNG